MPRFRLLAGKHIEAALDAKGAQRTGPASPISAKAPDFDKGLLEAMTVKELQAFAAEEEIDLRGATSKETILKVLRAVLPDTAVLTPAGK